MATFKQNGIQFNNVIAAGQRLPDKYGNGKNGSFEDAGTDGVEPFVNAVEIDWNGVSGIFGFTTDNPLNTTGQLLNALSTTCASKPNAIRFTGLDTLCLERSK